MIGLTVSDMKSESILCESSFSRIKARLCRIDSLCDEEMLYVEKDKYVLRKLTVMKDFAFGVWRISKLVKSCRKISH